MQPNDPRWLDAEVRRLTLEADLLADELNFEQKKTRSLEASDYENGYLIFDEMVEQETIGPLSIGIRRYARLYPGKELTLELNTPGGEIMAGLALYDTLLAFAKQAKLTIVVRGEASSMGAVLLQAAHTRVVGSAAHLMLHRSSFGAMGEAHKIEDSVETTKMFEGTIYRIIGTRSGKGAPHWKTKLGKRKDVWFTAQEAVDAGLADAIG